MPAVESSEQRRSQLEQLWLDNRYDFLAEYRRVVGQPPNDPTMSLKTIINRMIDRESLQSCMGS